MIRNYFQKKEIITVVVKIFIFSMIGFVVNSLIQSIYFAQHPFYYSISFLFGIFFLMATVIVLILNFIKKINLDYVGYSFLILTFIKMIVAYFIIRPVLVSTDESYKIDKANFFILFIYFLLIETLLTIRILNNKQ